MRPWRWLPSRLSFLYKLEPFRYGSLVIHYGMKCLILAPISALHITHPRMV